MIKINLYNNNRLHLKCKQHDIHLEAISKKKILFKKSKFAALVPSGGLFQNQETLTAKLLCISLDLGTTRSYTFEDLRECEGIKLLMALQVFDKILKYILKATGSQCCYIACQRLLKINENKLPLEGGGLFEVPTSVKTNLHH